MDIAASISDASLDIFPSSKESADGRSSYLRSQYKHSHDYCLPTHDQGKQIHHQAVDTLDNGQSWQKNPPKILDQDQIGSARTSADANTLAQEVRFRQLSVIGIDACSSDNISERYMPSHLGFHQATNPPPGCTLLAAEREHIPGSQSDIEQRERERLIKSKKLRGNPKRQILNPKPDSEVSAETRKRRAKRQKETIQRRRDKENRAKRVQNLQTEGVEAKTPCYECQRRGRSCIVKASKPLHPDAASGSTSSTLKLNLASLPSRATYESKCVPSPMPIKASTRKVPCSACRKHRTRCQKSRFGPNGPCDACCDRADKTVVIRQSPKANISQKYPCLNCIAHGRVCNFPPENMAVATNEQNHQLRSKKVIESFPVYTDKWFKAMLMSDRKKVLQHLIQTLDPYLQSGMARTGGPCTRCLSLGLKCMVIKPHSIAFNLSPNTTRCSNCLGDVGAGASGPWKLIRKCCAAEEGHILSMADNLASGSSLRSPKSSPSVQSAKIPLKDADNGNATMLRDFRRKSVRNFFYPLPKEALDPHEVSAKMNEMYFWIQKLSYSAFFLTNQTCERWPLSESELSQLESLTVNQSYPTVLDALQQLLGVSTSGDLRRRICELRLEVIPYMQVVCAVTSMTVYNVIFQEDPFADDLQTAMLIRILQSDQLYDPHKAGLALQWYHLKTLHEDLNFQAKLQDKANVAGGSLWNILEPLITLGRNNLAPSVLGDCRTFCSKIAEVAYPLNAGIKARFIHPQITWPFSSNPFDDECHEDVQGSSLQYVLLALSLCIKTNHPSGPPTVYAKSKVAGF